MAEPERDSWNQVFIHHVRKIGNTDKIEIYIAS